MNTYFITLCTIAIALAAQAGAEGMMPDVGSLTAMPEGMMGNIIPTDLIGGQEAGTEGDDTEEADDTQEADDTEDSGALLKRGLLSSGNPGHHNLLSADVNTHPRGSSHYAQEKSQHDGLLGDLLKRGYAPSHASKTQQYGSGSATSPMGALPLGGGQYGSGSATSPMGGLPMGGLPMGGLPKGGLPMGGLPMGGFPKGGLPMGGLPMGGLPMGGLPKGGLPMGGLPAGGSPMGGLPMGGLPMGGLPMGGSPMGGLPMGGLPGMSGTGSSPTYKDGEVTDATTHKPKHHASHYSRGLLSSAVPAGGLTDVLPLGGSNGFLKVRRSNQE